MKAPKGYRYRKTKSGEERLVCDACGSNCGQCGETDRLGNFVGVEWADGKSQMQMLVEALQPKPTLLQHLKAALWNPYVFGFVLGVLLVVGWKMLR